MADNSDAEHRNHLAVSRVQQELEMEREAMRMQSEAQASMHAAQLHSKDAQLMGLKTHAVQLDADVSALKAHAAEQHFENQQLCSTIAMWKASRIAMWSSAEFEQAQANLPDATVTPIECFSRYLQSKVTF